MAKMVVGLFDSMRDAHDVVRELRTLGLTSTDVDLLSQEAFGGSPADLLTIMTGAGIPDRGFLQDPSER